jgi:hypothetical protein
LQAEAPQPRVPPPFWGNRCAPAHARNTCGGLCAPTRCTCASHGPRTHEQLLQPPWWAPSDALLERLQSSEQSEPNPKMPVSVLSKPVPPAMGVGRVVSETRRISGAPSRYAFVRRGIRGAHQREAAAPASAPEAAVAASLTLQLWGDALQPRIGMMI